MPFSSDSLKVSRAIESTAAAFPAHGLRAFQGNPMPTFLPSALGLGRHVVMLDHALAAARAVLHALPGGRVPVGT